MVGLPHPHHQGKWENIAIDADGDGSSTAAHEAECAQAAPSLATATGSAAPARTPGSWMLGDHLIVFCAIVVAILFVLLVYSGGISAVEL